jgi:hypothetical protein
METEMVLPLLLRAEALLRLVIKQHRAEGRAGTRTARHSACSPAWPSTISNMTTWKDEAWYYREDNLDVWRQSGGLAWLRQALPKQLSRNSK